MSSEYNITLIEGSTFDRVVTLTDQASSAAIDISGATITAKIKPDYASTTTLATFTCSLVNDGTDGKFRMYMSAQTTAALTDNWEGAQKSRDVPRYGVYDLKISWDTDTVKQYLYGTVTLSREVSNG
jgi:hypothetical protein